MIFVDRIDVGAEALRSPDEIGRMLKDAEGKLGALTEVFGGTCVIGNMCPAKFACVGCAGNAPDPAKRYQIVQKLAWAEEQVGYAIRQQLPGEETKLKQLIADCKLVMEEMDLIRNRPSRWVTKRDSPPRAQQQVRRLCRKGKPLIGCGVVGNRRRTKPLRVFALR